MKQIYPIPPEVFANGMEPNLGPLEERVMGWVQGGPFKHLAPWGPTKWRGGPWELSLTQVRSVMQHF